LFAWLLFQDYLQHGSIGKDRACFSIYYVIIAINRKTPGFSSIEDPRFKSCKRSPQLLQVLKSFFHGIEKNILISKNHRYCKQVNCIEILEM